MFLLCFGLWAGWRYLHIKAPADTELQPVQLREVLVIAEIHNQYATNDIDAIELRTASHRIVRYGEFWPCFDRVRRRDTNLTVLVDSTNQVWLVKDAAGNEFGRDYFRKRNLEYKSVCAVVAILFLPLGALMLLPALVLEYGLRRDGKLPKDGSPVSARKFTLIAGLLVYLYVFGFVIGPWLTRWLPPSLVPLIWVLSAAVLVNLILRLFRPKSRG